MPRRNRWTPTAQLSLFKPHSDQVAIQNGRWIAAGTTTVLALIDATKREPEKNYGIQTETQRPLHRSHCLKIAEYFRTTDQWVIAPFIFTCESDSLELENGEFRSFKDDFKVLDGQHRIQALHITVDNLRDSPNAGDADQLNRLLKSAIALQYIENRGATDAAQLFVDLNKGKSITAAEMAYLDGNDPIVNVIKEVLSTLNWVRERTDQTRSTPDRRSNDVWTISTLKTILKAIEVGVRKPLPAARRRHISTPEGKQESVEDLGRFLQWLGDTRQEYHQLKDDPGIDVPDENTRHFAYDLKWMALLAETWSNAERNSIDTKQLAGVVKSLNINRNDAASNLSKFNLLNEREQLKPFGRGPYQEVSAQIRDSAQQRAVA